MDEIKQLLDERGRLITEAQAIMKKDAVSKEDEAKFHSLMDMSDALKIKAENVKRLRDTEKSQKDLGDIREERKIITAIDSHVNPFAIRATAEYAKHFYAAMRTPKDLWPTEVRAAMSTTPGADGGFLIPMEYQKNIEKKREEANVLRTIAQVITTRSTRNIPMELTRPSAFWAGENSVISESNATFAQKQIQAFKAANLQKLSTEFLQDEDSDFYSFLADANGRAFGILEETAFVAGTGTTQPLGLLAAGSGIGTVAAQAATALSVDDLFNIYYGVGPQFRARASFLMNDALAKAARMLKTVDGVFYLQPNLAGPGPDTLFGKPVYISPAMPSVMAKDAKTIVFGDFYEFIIADREGITQERLNEVFRTNGQIGFITEMRTDCLVRMPDAFKALLH